MDDDDYLLECLLERCAEVAAKAEAKAAAAAPGGEERKSRTRAESPSRLRSAAPQRVREQGAEVERAVAGRVREQYPDADERVAPRARARPRVDAERLDEFPEHRNDAGSAYEGDSYDAGVINGSALRGHVQLTDGHRSEVRDAYQRARPERRSRNSPEYAAPRHDEAAAEGHEPPLPGPSDRVAAASGPPLPLRPLPGANPRRAIAGSPADDRDYDRGRHSHAGSGKSIVDGKGDGRRWVNKDDLMIRPEKALLLPPLVQNAPLATPTVVAAAAADTATPADALPTVVATTATGGGPAVAAVAAPASPPSAISILTEHLFSIDAAGAMRCSVPPASAIVAALPEPPPRIHSTGVDPIGTVLNSHAARCLRPYQRVGVAWMVWRLQEVGGCVLGDDMGLGKTCQAAAALATIFGKTGIRANDDVHLRRVREGSLPTGVSGRGSASGDAGAVPTPLSAVAADVLSTGARSLLHLPVLILVPKAVAKNWERELAAWGWFVVRLLGDAQNKAARSAMLRDAESGRVEIILATYEMALLHLREEVAAVKWGVLVLDEAHKLKNSETSTYKAARTLRQSAQYCIGLTGTPMQNNMMELYCVFDLIIPGCLGAAEIFDARFAKPISKAQEKPAAGISSRDHQRIIADGHTKRTQLRLDLQARVYTRFLASADAQTLLGAADEGDPTGPLWRMSYPSQDHLRDDYKQRRRALLGPVLVLLQRMCSHVELIKTPLPKDEPNPHRRAMRRELSEELLPAGGVDTVESTGPMGKRELGGKLAALLAILTDAQKAGEKTLVFSRLVRLLVVIEAFLRVQYDTKFNVRMYYGGMGDDARERVVSDFNTGDANVLLVSLKAGGVGLNLTAASRVVLFDPDWNPANDLQAQDRAYRIGQTRDVTVYRMLTIGTIEEAMYVRQLKKIQVAQSLTDGGNAPRMIAADDVTGIGSLLKYVPDGIVATRFKEYQAEKAAGRLLMTRDDVADVVKRELAAKLAAVEEGNADGEAGADQAASGVKRDRKSRGGRGSSHRGGGDSDSESAGEGDELGDGDPDILAELEEDAVGSAAERHAVAGRGAGAPGLLFASQDVQLAHHADYIAEEEYEGQVTVAAVAQTDQDDRERSAARTTAIEGLHDEHRHRKAKRQRRKRSGDDAEAISAATRLPPLVPPDSPPPGSEGPQLAEDDASSAGGLGDGGVTRALQQASGLVVVPVVGRGRRPPAGGVAGANVKPYVADVKPALQSLEGLPPAAAAPPAPTSAALPSARVASGYCSLGDSEEETGPDPPQAEAAVATDAPIEPAMPAAPVGPVMPVAPLAAAALLPSRPRDTIDELCDDVA